jgi:hypothetical protein
MGGFYTGSDLATKVFYGFRMNPNTGNLDIEILDGDIPVSLPDPDYIIDPYAYQQWFWSKDTVQFLWGSGGHLLMRLV